MPSLFAQSELSDLIEKVEKGERLDFGAGVRMMDSQDILALGYMANLVRQRKNGNQTYFIVNGHIKEAGLDSLQGGGAEIFPPRVRAEICEKKVSRERWLEIQEAAHRLEIRTNATMLYGHIESTEEQVEHLLQLRELQDRTGGFLTFIPLPFYPKNTNLERNMGIGNTTGFEDLKMLSISRILLDNFGHIKASWIMLGPKLAQVSLAFGVDDLDGTVVEEQIIHSAGTETSQVMSKRALIDMIQKAGRDAVERDTLYRVLKTY